MISVESIILENIKGNRLLYIRFILFSFFFFFFQAEDGIRDVAVTGVQTCAFPIWRWLRGVVQVLGTQCVAHPDEREQGEWLRQPVPAHGAVDRLRGPVVDQSRQ